MAGLVLTRAVAAYEVIGIITGMGGYPVGDVSPPVFRYFFAIKGVFLSVSPPDEIAGWISGE